MWTFSADPISLKKLGLRDAKDTDIFEAARQSNAVIMTKDSDFIDLACRLGIPPQILWLTCGNVTNRNLQKLLSLTLVQAIIELKQGENIVEINQINLA